MIRLAGVAKKFGANEALKPIDIEFGEGRVTALIGPSGCGKSTLLRLVAGLVEPDQGSIHFDGQEITRSNLSQVRQRIGYVIQDGGLFPHLTARQNVLLLADHLGRRGDVRLGELLELTQFPEDGLDRYPLELSGGQRQRVALMRALALDPMVLLLDEPLGALDPLIRADLQKDLKRIFAEVGHTVVLVTHDMGEAAYLADRIVLMRDGAIVQDGSLKDFQETPSELFVTDFLNAQRSVVAL
jgi:osmoprotectant transport system ATP-binding protein